MSEWISVKDRLPEIGVPVLIVYLGYNDRKPRSSGIASIDGSGAWGWWDGDDADETVCVDITHWMPLPPPPEEAAL